MKMEKIGDLYLDTSWPGGYEQSSESSAKPRRTTCCLIGMAEAPLRPLALVSEYQGIRSEKGQAARGSNPLRVAGENKKTRVISKMVETQRLKSHLRSSDGRLCLSNLE